MARLAERDGSVAPNRGTLAQERVTALPGARCLRRRRHRFQRDRVRVGLRAVQLGVEGLLAQRLVAPAAAGSAAEQLVHGGVEGLPEARWVLMDYLDVVVHVFTPEAREFYRLEQLWGEAPRRAVAQ